MTPRRSQIAAPAAATEVRSAQRGQARIDPLGAGALVAALLGLLAALFLFLTSNPGLAPLR